MLRITIDNIDSNEEAISLEVHDAGYCLGITQGDSTVHIDRDLLSAVLSAMESLVEDWSR